MNIEIHNESVKKARAYQQIFNTDEGKLVLDDLEKFTGFKIPASDGGNLNALGLAYRAGKRDVYIRIRQFLEMEIGYE
ncbi:MAG TPA: hypothetical protein P5033_09765 [Anaerohalosphaeraceae bacterium]|nr:hypothetical protein [Anaerohalosphaeraceae bacterium]HRT24355.1 hypothetical protein [Anaerohalosphaeraceae bacterium]